MLAPFRAYGWFQWLAAYISLSTTLRQLFLSLLTTSALAAACTNLLHPAHSHMSISHVSLLSLSQHHHSRLNHFKIYFRDNEFE
jgi:hypothetical protein